MSQPRLPTPDGERIKQARILVVDDEAANVRLLERLLTTAGYSQVQSTTNSAEAVGLFDTWRPDLLLLDLHMPSPDGFDILEQLRPDTLEGSRVPVLVLTADVTPAPRQRALASGARDFLSKPFDLAEVLLRIANLLESRHFQLALENRNDELRQGVEERTMELDEARIEILERLALAAEFRDDGTHQHAQRVGRTAALLAWRLGWSEEKVELMRRAATLHDVGKLGIPDALLLKPAALTPAEYDAVKEHVHIGRRILSGSRSPLLRLAEEIAMTHHERWDGTGYPHGLVGAGISIWGRLVAVADTFDAVAHSRPYKDARPVGEAVAEIMRLSGECFDPEVVEAFAGLDHEALLGPITNPDVLPLEVVTEATDAVFRLSRVSTPADPTPTSRRSENGHQPSTMPPAKELLTLGQASDALNVSASTLKRWDDAGRIRAVRTPGGHRRFHVDEVRRVAQERGAATHSAVRALSPPARPLPGLGQMFETSGEDLLVTVTTALYEGEGQGWFATEEARPHLLRWQAELAGNCRDGRYSEAISATRALTRTASIGGATLLECHNFLNLMRAATVRALTTRDADGAELSAAQRLFAAFAQRLLEDQTSGMTSASVAAERVPA